MGVINVSLPDCLQVVVCKWKVLVAPWCLILCDPMDCSPPGSSVHGTLQARIPEWVAMPSSRGSSQSRDWTHVSCISSIGRRVLYHSCHLGSSFKAWDGTKLAREGMWTRRYPSISKLRGWGSTLGVCLRQGPPAPERLKLTRSHGISVSSTGLKVLTQSL